MTATSNFFRQTVDGVDRCEIGSHEVAHVVIRGHASNLQLADVQRGTWGRAFSILVVGVCETDAVAFTLGPFAASRGIRFSPPGPSRKSGFSCPHFG